MHHGTEGPVLLVGANLQQRKDIIAALNALRLKAKFVNTGYEAISEICRDTAKIVFVDSEVSDIPPHELSRQIKLSQKHRSLPVICIFGTEPCIGDVLDAFNAGADDCFTGEIQPVQLMAKIEWLIMRRNSAAALRQYYSELRNRQSQTLDVVRATADLLESIEDEFRWPPDAAQVEHSELFEEKLEIGLGMICSLASILEQQIDSFDISELVEQTDAPDPIEVHRTGRSISNRAVMELAR